MNAREVIAEAMYDGNDGEGLEWPKLNEYGRAYWYRQADDALAALRADPEALADLCGPMMAVAEHEEILALAVDTINETHRTEMALLERQFSEAVDQKMRQSGEHIADLLAERDRVRDIVREQTPSHFTRDYKPTDQMRDNILAAIDPITIIVKPGTPVRFGEGGPVVGEVISCERVGDDNPFDQSRQDVDAMIKQSYGGNRDHE